MQIFKVSGKASVRKDDIKEEINVRDIQPYIINNYKVVLLKSKEGSYGYPNCVIISFARFLVKVSTAKPLDYVYSDIVLYK